MVYLLIYVFILIYICEQDSKGRSVFLQLFKIVQLQFQYEAAWVASRTGRGDFYHLYWWNQGLPRCYQPSKDDPRVHHTAGKTHCDSAVFLTRTRVVPSGRLHSSTQILTTDLAEQVSGLGTQQDGLW